MVAIPAAGTVPWRLRDGQLEVALVHRPRYDDWAWAKGKLDPGEEWCAAAVRETHEETGLRVRLGRPLPESRYTILERTGEVSTKVVRYWAAQVTSGDIATLHEIDEVAWLEMTAAHDRLDYARDRDQLRSVVRMHQEGSLDTWPLLVIRHAKALPRAKWGGDDWLRTLDERGLERSRALVPVLAAYAPERLFTSSATRCVQTLEPYAAHSGLALRRRDGLSEEGFEANPGKAAAHTLAALEGGRPLALCGHGPVLPSMLDVLVERLDPTGDGAVELVETVAEARDDKLVKGEVLVCHVVGAGAQARIVAAERHLP